MVGPQPPLSKHFTLTRKPKSAALRAELTHKGIFWLLINDWKKGHYLELLDVLFYAAMAQEAVQYHKWPSADRKWSPDHKWSSIKNVPFIK